jgi:methylase of polypeptide subunit release factors
MNTCWQALIGRIRPPIKGRFISKPEVVEFMLTAMAFQGAETLKNVRILEPSCGEGQFVVAIAKHLLNQAGHKLAIEQLFDKVLAVDLVEESVGVAKSKVTRILIDAGYSALDITKLLSNWFLTTDFLLTDITANFTHVIGNPPYVRVENIAAIALD